MIGVRRGNPVQFAGRNAAVLVLLLAAGCATRVTASKPSASPELAGLARPTRVLVTDFTVDPGSVRQDQAIGLRLQRAFNGSSAGPARESLAAEVQSAIADTLVASLDKAGLPAERAPADVQASPGDVVITGHVQRIDEGNRTRRMTVGFGAGKSIVEATAELYAAVPGGAPMLLQSYDGSADSGRKPGLAVGAGMAVANSSAVTGALSVAMNVSGERNRTPVGREATSLGRRLATEIGTYAAGRGWIPASAVPAWSR